MNEDWLPELLCLEDFGGDWEIYLSKLYEAFQVDFIWSKPQWPGKRFALKRHPEYEGKAITFWHIISEGFIEANRLPDLRRCERICWPLQIINEYSGQKPQEGDRILWWKNQRKNEDRVILALRDFSYVVIIAERSDFVMLWTAYPVALEHSRRKLQKEYEDYWKNQP